MKDYTNNVVCVALSFGMLGTSRTDTEETAKVAEANGASTRQTKVVKQILTKRASGHWLQGVGPHQKLRTEARSYLYSMSFPGITNDLRVLPVSKLADLQSAVTGFKARDTKLTQELMDRWDEEIEYDKSSQGLGTLFDPDLYPTKDELPFKFTIDLRVVDFPKGDFARLGLFDEAFTKAHEKLIVDVGLNARKALYKRLTELVGHIAEKLSNPDAKNFYESTFGNLKEFLKELPTLDFTGDPNLEALRTECQAKLDHSMAYVKDNEFLKDSIANDAKAILSKIGGRGRKILAA